MQSLKALANLVRYKIAGEPYHHNLFRVGMVLTLDPTPFILARGATKVADLAAAGTTSVQAVSSVIADQVVLTRLYLDGDGSFLQIWVDGGGAVQECRLFTRHDQETPPDTDTWQVWLGETDGLIGWTQFQTLDEKLYDRQWSPGLARIEPVLFDETVTTAQGTLRRSLRSMLYAAGTGLAAPAPATEYLLVSAVDDGDQAWVDIHAGIDLNPASLTLA